MENGWTKDQSEGFFKNASGALLAAFEGDLLLGFVLYNHDVPKELLQGYNGKINAGYICGFELLESLKNPDVVRKALLAEVGRFGTSRAMIRAEQLQNTTGLPFLYWFENFLGSLFKADRVKVLEFLSVVLNIRTDVVIHEDLSTVKGRKEMDYHKMIGFKPIGNCLYGELAVATAKQLRSLDETSRS